MVKRPEAFLPPTPRERREEREKPAPGLLVDWEKVTGESAAKEREKRLQTHPHEGVSQAEYMRTKRTAESPAFAFRMGPDGVWAIRPIEP
jgi:hypothetical protein